MTEDIVVGGAGRGSDGARRCADLEQPPCAEGGFVLEPRLYRELLMQTAVTVGLLLGALHSARPTVAPAAANP